MQCEEFEIQLNEALDRRSPLTAADALAHQRACSQCRERAAAYLAIARELARAPWPAAPEDLAPRVLAELQDPAIVPLARRRRRRPSLALAAAALLIAVVGGWALNRGGFFGQETRRQMAGRSDEAKSPVRAAVRKQRAQTPPQVARSSQRSRPSRQPKNTIAPALPDAESLPAAEWAQQVADGFQPVTRPTLGAAAGFLQVWGVGQKRPPSGQRPRS